MPIDIRSLQKKGVTVPVPMYGEELNVTYDPFKLTREFREDWQQRINERIEAINAEHEDDDTGRWEALELAQAEAMVEVIRSWDLVDGGDPYPLDPERIANELPGISVVVQRAVFTDVALLGNRNGSPTGSSRTRRGSNLRAV